MQKMFENHKRTLKYVFIIVFVLFTLNKCTTSCTRGTKIDKLNVLNTVYVSQIDSLHKVLEQKDNEINLLNVKVNGLSDLNTAVSAEREKIDEVNQKLNDKNTNTVEILKRKVNEQNAVIRKLNKKIEELQKH